MLFVKYLSFIFFLLCCQQRSLAGQAQPLARQGEIDLSAWDFNRDGSIIIKGEWQFFPDRVFTADELLSEQFLKLDKKYIQSGQSWETFTNQSAPLHKASYLLKIHGLETTVTELSLFYNQFAFQHQTWLYRPKTHELIELAEVGRLGVDEKTWINQMRPIISNLPIFADEDVYLISSCVRYDLKGSFTLDPELGSRASLGQREVAKSWQSFFVLGMFSLLAISNFSLYLLRPEDKPSLYLGFFALLMGLRFFSTEATLSRFYPEPSYLTFIMTIGPIAFALPIGLNIYTHFFNLSFPGQLPENRVNLIWLPMLPLTIAAFAFREQAIVILSYTLLFQLAVSLLIISKLIRLTQQRVRSATMALIGFALLFLAMFNDVLIALVRAYDFAYLGHYGMIAFIFCQSLVVGSNFANAFRTADRLSRHLQDEVQQQTEKLQLQKDKLEEQKQILEVQQIQLVGAHDELKEADQQKTKFFRSISHELRTPLTLILGSLREHLSQVEMPEAIDMARRNAKRLFRLVNQLLDFQKIALAKHKIRLEPIDLHKFLENISHYFADTCKKRQILFTIKLEGIGSEHFKVLGQVDALEKVVFNYLANALKYSPKGGSIELRLERRAKQARISVTDSGIGIPVDQQDKLFKLFSQIEGRQLSEEQGTGLGLALVKELVELMHGTVGVISAPGQGAQFWAELPLMLAGQSTIDFLILDPNAQRAVATAAKLSRSASNWKLVIVKSIEEAELVLRREGARILCAMLDTGEGLNAFLELAKTIQPSIRRLLLADAGQIKQDTLKQISASEIDQFQTLPFAEAFIRELEQTLSTPQDASLPILDLVYVEDEATMRTEFSSAVERHTILQNYKMVATGAQLKALLQTHQIRVLIADANLSGESGTDLLAFVGKASPDTFRIILTGETSTDLVSEGISKAQVHHILYKPCNYKQELQLLVNYVERSPIKLLEKDHSRSEDIQDWHFAGVEAPSPTTLTSAQEYSRPEGRKAVILIVDDIADMLGIIGGMLRANGYHVLNAHGGFQALEIVRDYPQLVDLIITDWLMPGMEGPQLIEALHASEDTATIPTILLTAKTDVESKAEGIRIGASAFLGKPFDERELLSTVDNLLDLKKRERKIEDLNQFINQNILQRFLPPDLVKDLLAGKAIFDDSARMRPITVMFADIVNFTRSTEVLGTTRIAKVLNDFFVKMTDIIFDHGGTIDKFMGDGILIFFGAPQSMEAQDQVSQACRCAKAMITGLEELNKVWTADFDNQFQMRIGMHHGPAIVGSFGGKKRSEYTAIGNTVNIASRVESKAEPGQVLFTAAVRDYLDHRLWRAAGSFKLKGVDSEVMLYSLVLDSLQNVA